MKLIAAVSSEWGIGYNNDLLFHIPEDMKFFRSKTKDNVIITGRKTLESFPGGKPLKNRINIVLTNNKSYKVEDAVTVNTVSELFNRLDTISGKEIFVCGGEQIYKLLLPYCDTAFITKIEAHKLCDKFFPNLDNEPCWRLTNKSERHSDNGLDFTFLTYTNSCPEGFTYNNRE